jgi:glycosyltransferase involved in cell wall biosynthesis
MKIRTKNAVNYISLDICDRAISPTEWQLRQHPPQYRSKFSVIHDGVDTEILKPNPNAAFDLPDGSVVHPGDEVVTYVNRGMEPFRGLFTFIDAAAMVAKQRPNCRFLIVGRETGRYYGPGPQSGKTFTDIAKSKLASVQDRFYFLGSLPYQQYVNLLQVSAAHVYLTRPFVLSWSMLEAMSVGALVIGSATPPVTEVIDDDMNGLLFDFFSPDELAERIDEALTDQSRMQEIRQAARGTVIERYALERCLPRQIELIESTLGTSATAPSRPPS